MPRNDVFGGVGLPATDSSVPQNTFSIDPLHGGGRDPTVCRYVVVECCGKDVDIYNCTWHAREPSDYLRSTAAKQSVPGCFRSGW